MNESHKPHVTCLSGTQIVRTKYEDVRATRAPLARATDARAPARSRDCSHARLAAQATAGVVCALASYLKTELLRLKYSRALLDPQLGKSLQSFFKGVAFRNRVDAYVLFEL